MSYTEKEINIGFQLQPGFLSLRHYTMGLLFLHHQGPNGGTPVPLFDLFRVQLFKVTLPKGGR